MSDDFTALLARTRYLLLDFDGPICAIFAGRSAQSVVEELLELLFDADVDVPPELATTGDPFDVLRHAATMNAGLAQQVEQVLCAAEVDAARSARPTPHSNDLIRAWPDAGRELAVVSNNSLVAVRTYLDLHQLDVPVVAARADADPQHLKPSPFLVLQGLTALQARADASALLGDSITDVVASQSAGIASIGFANKPGKHDMLSHAGADVVIDEIQTIVRAVSHSRA